MYERLLDILNNAGRPKVLLVGDFMLDNYLYGDIDRISPEAPVVILNATERQDRPGGAGSVAVDLAALGVELACAGVVGDDENGKLLKNMLADMNATNVEAILTSTDRPTTTKQRIIGLAQHRHRQQLMRIDQESDSEIAEATKELLKQKLKQLIPWSDVVCLEDYNKGVLCDEFCREVISMANQHGKKVIVDPAATAKYDRYAGAWMIKPNRRELQLATAIKIDGQKSRLNAAKALAEKYDIENVVVTLDKEGAFLYQRPKDQSNDRSELIPTRVRSVYDVTGAGDMMLAVLGLLAGATFPPEQSPGIDDMVCLANVAAGLEVERFGCVGISRNEIIAELVREYHRGPSSKLRSVESLLEELQWHRRQKMDVVFTNGCFDILHPGHIKLLTAAKARGDILIVAVNSDQSVRKLKGPTRPILSEQDRAALLSALEAVDYIVIFDEQDPLELIKKITPEVLVKGSDWTGKVIGQDWVEQNGGKVVIVPLSKGLSTTDIIEQVIKQNSNNE